MRKTEIRKKIAEKKEEIEDLKLALTEQEIILADACDRQADIVNTKERYEDEYEAEMDETQCDIDDAEEAMDHFELQISNLESEIFELEKKLDDLGRIPREALFPDHPGQMRLFERMEEN